jgi:molybdopterin synthase sulfur carrier subunit
MEIKVYATLREVVGGKSIHIDTTPKMTVRHMLEEIVAIHPALHSEIFGPTNQLRSSIHILVNGRNTRFLAGMDTRIQAGDQISIFPPVGGGASQKMTRPAGEPGSGAAEEQTTVTLKFTTRSRERMSRDRMEFAFAGNTLRELLNGLCTVYDLRDLVFDHKGEGQPGLQVVVNGRFSYLTGDLDTPIRDGDLVVLIHRSTVAL